MLGRWILSTGPIAGVREFQRLQAKFGWDVDRLESGPGDLFTTRGARPQSAFDYEDNSLAGVADDSWWFRARNQLIEPLVQRHAAHRAIWDVGGGLGTVAQHLSRHGIDVVVVEPDLAGASTAASKNLTAIAGSLQDLELPDRSLESIGLFDVIEHLPDPVSMLSEVQRVLSPTGRLFVSVPALRFLWSGADEISGHNRRYTVDSLRSEAALAGLVPLEMGYWFASLVVPMLLLRTVPSLIGQECTPSAYTSQLQPSRNFAISALLTAERATSRLAIPGTSAFGVFATNH